MPNGYWGTKSAQQRRWYARERNVALDVICPHCGAMREYPCRFPDGGRRTRPHKERIDLGKDAQELEARLMAEEKQEALARKRRPVTAEDMDAWVWGQR